MHIYVRIRTCLRMYVERDCVAITRHGRYYGNHHAMFRLTKRKKRFYLNNPHNIVVIIVLEWIGCYIILLSEDLVDAEEPPPKIRAVPDSLLDEAKYNIYY